MQLMKRIQAGLRPDISLLPPALAQLVEDCLQEDPQLRPSFSEVIIRLRRCNSLKLPRYINIEVATSSYASPNETITLRDEFMDSSFRNTTPISSSSSRSSAIVASTAATSSSSSSSSSSRMQPQRLRFKETDLLDDEPEDDEDSEDEESTDNFFSQVQP